MQSPALAWGFLAILLPVAATHFALFQFPFFRFVDGIHAIISLRKFFSSFSVIYL